MLDNTHDPIADFMSQTTADVLAFCANITYEQFLENSSRLSQMESFPQLVSQAESIGYTINNVVFRGLKLGEVLQKIHDEAIYESAR